MSSMLNYRTHFKKFKQLQNGKLGTRWVKCVILKRWTANTWRQAKTQLILKSKITCQRFQYSNYMLQKPKGTDMELKSIQWWLIKKIHANLQTENCVWINSYLFQNNKEEALGLTLRLVNWNLPACGLKFLLFCEYNSCQRM